MIFLHHCAMSRIFPHAGLRLNPTQRQDIRDYRHQRLIDFCTQHQLPEPAYSITSYGKPIIHNIPQLQFNHAHCASYYALAYSLTAKKLGVDVESLNRSVRFERVAQHAFHPDEYQNWLIGQQNKEDWFKIWTIKEAVLKASGIGIRINLHELNACVSVDDIPHQGLITHEKIGSYYFQCYTIAQHVITVAYSAEHPRVPIVFR